MKTLRFFIGSLFLICFVSACTTEDLDIPITEEQVLASTNKLDVNEATLLLEDFVGNTLTKSGTAFNIKSHKVKTLCIDNAEILPLTIKDTIPIYEFVTETDGQEGYSFVVGDKRIKKILISVPFGSPSDTSFIEPLRLYFRDIPMLIKEDLQQYYADMQEKAIQTKMSVESVYRFTSTSWGQGYPYNAKCPNQSMAGCVAIAVSQILAYHKVPSNLNWSSILASRTVTSSSDATVIDQVSTLVHDVGVALHTEYGLFESNAPSTYIASTLSSYGLSCSGVARFNVFDCHNIV